MAMRVLHILNDVTDRGNGIVNTAVDLALEQARQGLAVAVASAGGGYKPLLESAGVLHLALDQSRRPAQLLRAMRSLGTMLSDFRPDIVHAHMCTGMLLAWLWKHFNRFALIGHVHNVHDRQSVMMGLADRVIASSQSVATTMRAQGIPKRKIRVVLNRTLDSPRCPSLAEIEPRPLIGRSIVTVCGMNHRKGIAELIAAFERIGSQAPDAHLYLVGDGPDREQFERQARASSRPNHIHFEGYQALPQAYMLSAEVFVLASRRESFGLVLIEARQAGCAIVATDVDGIAEALDGGSAGLLVPSGDVNALAQALGRLLNDEDQRRQWRSRAKAGIANFHVQRMASEIKTVYDEPLAGECSRGVPGEFILK
jgi:glycosyltransferase involved in cell wall biosynthesis